jgi:hypothetical protein
VSIEANKCVPESGDRLCEIDLLSQICSKQQHLSETDSTLRKKAGFSLNLVNFGAKMASSSTISTFAVKNLSFSNISENVV